MRRLLALLVVFLLIGISLNAEIVRVGSGTNTVTVESATQTETIINVQIAEFSAQQQSISGDIYYALGLAGEAIRQDKGFPELPILNRSLMIPAGSGMELEILSSEYIDLPMAVVPSKGVLTRDQDPATIPYTFDPVYEKNAFYPERIAELSEPYILRDFRGMTVRTDPFAYNPKTKTLRVYTSYRLRVYASGLNSLNAMTREVRSINTSFVPIYENHFINYAQTRYTPVDESFGKLIVIAPASYVDAITPYVNWKRQKGITTELVQFGTIGTTAAQLQTYIQNRYTADPDISYIQLVGDAAQIPSLSSGGGGSDPSFALVAGSDSYPDIFIGRFSAETVADVTTQVNRTITYERDLTTSATWLSNGTCIASAEGGGTQGDDGESDIAHQNNIRTDMLGYGYTTVDQIYDSGATAAQVSTAVNAGRGWMNYTGHGADTYWVTTGFSNTNIASLTNDNKLPFIVDVACVNGNFVSLTCFAEAWMRAKNSTTGNPTGAIAIYASTINQSWNSPMCAQDEVVDLMVAGSKTTAGGLYYNGSCKMIDEYTTDGISMFKTWHIFGDASLLVRTKTPQSMTVSHPATITIGTSSITVNTGVSGALVALTYNNTIYGTAIANSSGVASLTLVSPPASAITYTLTVTALNKVTYTGSIQQVPASGVYMTATGITYDDSNNDLPDYNESGLINVTFNNIGTSTATGVTAVLSSASSGVTITDNTHTIASLAAGGSSTATGAYAISLANNIANGTVLSFTITMTTGSSNQTTNFDLTVNAPALSFGTATVSDPTGNGNSTIDPGETVTITIPLNNTGASASPAGSATISSSTTGITILTGTASFASVAASGNASLSFSVNASSSMSSGTLANFTFSVSAGAYSGAGTANLEVGAATPIIIGTGTSSQSYPIDRYYNYSAHEAIYLASEIGYAGLIKSLSFYKASGTNVNAIDAVTIYMKHTSATTLATGTYDLTGYTQVYTGPFTNNAVTGWMEVELNSRYTYNGVANLSILILKGYQAYVTDYPMWRYTTSSTSRARQNRSDTTAPTSLTSTTYLPNLRINMLLSSGQILYPPQNLSATASHATVNLSWQAPISGSPTGYKVYRGGALLTTVTGLTYTDTAVTDGTTYSYYLKAAYSGGDSDATATVNATPQANPPTNLTATPGNTIVNLSWTAAAGRELDLLSTTTDRAISGYRVYRNSTAITTVTGTTYQDTGLSNGTSYSFYVTTLYANPAGESAPSITVNATPSVVTSVIIGTGTTVTGTTVASPINVYWESLHGQSVYTAAELTAAGMTGPVNITQLGFYVNTSPSLTIPNFIVRMKHTTATNVASWQTATGMQTVYTAATYMPAAGGYDMLTLTTPFAWNGIDNIVVDTAFGVLTSYTSTGTVQYTSTTSGYRYLQVDDIDQTNIFTGGQTSVYRPNIKLVFAPQQTGPSISASPASVTASAVTGNTTTGSVTISNSGNAALTWSSALANVVSPQWVTYSPSSGSIAAGSNVTINFNFNTAGLLLGTVSNSLVITSNAVNNPSLSISISFTVQPGQYPATPRYVAEWEPMRAAIIRYPLGIPYTIVKEMAEDALVYTIVADAATQTTATSNYVANGVNTANCRWIIAPTDSYWTRDYGAWFVFDSNNQLSVVDFPYNRPRVNDDAVPQVVASTFSLPLYTIPVTHTGGNIMTDGKGKAASTYLVTEENTITEAQIRTAMQQYLGVTDYQLYTDPNNTYIDHIDCWAKYLDVDKVLIRRVPSTHAQYSAIEASVADFASRTSSYGTPYRIFRVDTPNNEPYTNSYILNSKIFVPQMGTANDAAALQAYRNAMPGYEILGFVAGSNVWESTDAIHCRINGIPEAQMVSITHTPVASWTSHTSLNLNVTLQHAGTMLADSTYVGYKVGRNGVWNRALLSAAGASLFTASLPAVAYGDTIYYMINARDISGNRAQMPLCGKNDPFSLVVDQVGFLEAPVVSVTTASSSVTLSWQAIPGAQQYRIYCADSPDGIYSLVGTTTQPTWNQPVAITVRRFYKVIASSVAR